MSSGWNRDRDTGCPCKGCECRSVGCHGGCERYGAWRKELDEKNHAEREYRRSRNTISETAIRKMWREQRRNRKRLKEDFGLK